MSYSRWSTSKWYTFWSSNSDSCEYKFPTKNLKRKQIFEICNYPKSYYISYYDLEKHSIEKILNDVNQVYPSSSEELEELKKYILEFKKSVDDSFKWKTFFEYEWWYPLRNKIITIIKIILNGK